MRISYIDEFLELYKCVNFNEAARNLFISQSTLSKHIKALEEDLGVTLFNRDKYYTEITPQGSEFHSYALQISKIYKAAQEQFANESAAKGRFLIGGLVESYRELDWLNRSTVKMRETHPAFKPMYIPSGLNSPMSELSAGNLDALIVAFYDRSELKGGNDGFTSIHLKDVPIMAVVSPESDLAGLSEVKAEDLKRKVFIHMIGPRMQSGWRSMEEFLGGLHIEFDTRIVPIMSMYDYPSITLAPNEVLLVPKCELAPANHTADPFISNFVTLPIAEQSAFTPLDLVYRTNNAPRFIQQLARVFKETPLFASTCPDLLVL